MFAPFAEGRASCIPCCPTAKRITAHAVPCKCAKKAEAGKRRLRLEEYSNLGALKNLHFEKLSPQGRNGSQRQPAALQRGLRGRPEIRR